MNETQDIFTILNGAVKMRKTGGYMPTSDTMWLAGKFRRGRAATVLDAGVGSGGVALCLLAKHPDLAVTGIDISEQRLSDAWANALLNGREIELILKDITKWKTDRLFDAVVTNPPYFAGTARKDGAHHGADIYEWTVACVRRLRPRGSFFCIVPEGLIDKAIAALYVSKCGAIEIHRVAADRVVITARKGVKTPAKIVKS